MSDKIITISRQYGSGGREIGARLAKRLDIPFYDKEIIILAAKQSGISDDFFNHHEQGDYLFRNFFSGDFVVPSLNDKIYLAQCAVIQALAAKGPCVIVGRGAGSVLKKIAPLLNVFLYADKELRARRTIEEYGEESNQIKERMDSIDKKRAAYFKFYAGIMGRQMENYHLCIDSGSLGIENTVTLIENAYLMK